MAKSAFRIENHRTFSAIMSTHALVLNLKDVSLWPRVQFYQPPSWQLSEFSTDFSTQFSGTCWDLRRCLYRTGFHTLSLANVLSLAVAFPGPAYSDLNSDWIPLSFWYGKGGSWGFGIGRLGRREANAQACFLEWWLAGNRPGRGGTPVSAHALWAERAGLPVPVGPSVQAWGVLLNPPPAGASGGRWG